MPAAAAASRTLRLSTRTARKRSCRSGVQPSRRGLRTLLGRRGGGLIRKLGSQIAGRRTALCYVCFGWKAGLKPPDADPRSRGAGRGEAPADDPNGDDEEETKHERERHLLKHNLL